MTAPIVQSSEPVTLIGDGEIGADDLALALARAPVLVAADGGAHAALKAGVTPKAVIGDMDSLTSKAMAQLPKDSLFQLAEQDSTDFEKALRAIRAPLVLAVGFLGARIDHQLSVLNTLVRRSDHRCILIGASEVIFHAPPKIELDLAVGDIVSLFPMADVRARSQGLEWPVDELELSPWGKISTSNRALGPVRLETNTPGLLVMVPRDTLDNVMQALGSA